MTINFKPIGQELYDEIAASHPSLLRGRVYCPRCMKTRRVDAAECLRVGWPKCSCGAGTMSIEQPKSPENKNA